MTNQDDRAVPGAIGGLEHRLPVAGEKDDRWKRSGLIAG